VPVAVGYKGRKAGDYRADVVVDERVIVEVKATRFLDSHAEHQLLNYLRASQLEVGLLMHFGPKPFFKRLVSTNARGTFIRDAIPPR
jgi:GxxExxY protein